MQLLQLQQEKDLLNSKFQFLLNSETEFVPEGSSFKMATPVTIEAKIEQHPLLQSLEQKKKTASAQTSLEKAKKLPTITLGYNNTSITGTGADNVIYDKNTRFQSAQVGLGIPLFGGSQNAKIKASKIQESIAENELEKERLSLENQLKNVLFSFEKNKEQLAYFEKTALPNATIITETANKQFLGGEINYLDWVMLVNQSININNQYIDSVNMFNESIIQLNYLTSKN